MVLELFLEWFALRCHLPHVSNERSCCWRGEEERRNLEILTNDWKPYVMIVVCRNWEASFVHMQKSLEYVHVASSK
jgi:hypothetical protein